MKEYTLKLTADEVWALISGYEASFAAPEEKNAAEQRVTEKLSDLMLKVHRDKKKGRG